MPAGPKLRAPALDSPFHVVLIEPEIPPNTGAVARTCAATGSALHLVGKLGFRLDEQSVRRAGLDYWPLVDVHQHEDWSGYEHVRRGRKLHLLTSSSPRSIFEAPVQEGDAFVFGKESVGLDPAFLAQHPDDTYGIPTLGPVRSLNLSNAVAIVLFQALHRLGALRQTGLG